MKTQRWYGIKKIFYALSVFAIIFAFVSCQNVAYVDKLGDVDVSMGNHRLAIEDYTKAIELVPDDSNLYFARGSALALLGNDDQSIREYQKAAALGNDKAQVSLISKGIGW